MQVKVKFLPDKEVLIPQGATLKFAIQKAGINFELPCGGEGICGKCKLKIISPNPPPPTEAEKRLIPPSELEKGYRLACKCTVWSDTVVELSEVKSASVSSTPHIFPHISFTADFPERCPENRRYMAVDLGTTTISLCIMEGSHEKIVHTHNPQTAFGGDVISRISHAQSNLNELRKPVMELLKRTAKGKLCAASVSGNPVMQAIVKREDLSCLGKYPFSKGRIKGQKVEVDFCENGLLCLPEIGGFLGGDSASLLLASSTLCAQSFIAIDIGTNTEILLKTEKKILGTSTPAGPAFEGYGIKSGTTSREGAVYLVDESLQVHTIGGTPPEGLCGSGLISAIYALKKNNLIDETGRLKKEKVELYPGIYITQEDIRAFQVAKAAIYASCKTLMDKSGAKIERLFLAGNFGSSLKKEWLIELKILPEELESSEFTYLGNTSLWGAKWYLISSEAREKMEELAQLVDIIYLSHEPEFEEEFIKGMQI
ncbi:MAG: DUF4445 domain-containing protein [Deferribacteres bacterium]|nr:DUF4445 domain-containing protein [Deferribacteres bacterium]